MERAAHATLVDFAAAVSATQRLPCQKRASLPLIRSSGLDPCLHWHTSEFKSETWQQVRDQPSYFTFNAMNAARAASRSTIVLKLWGRESMSRM